MEMAIKTDLYDALGVDRGASQDEIKKVYRRLARKHHPDLNPGDKKAEERFKEVNEAYEILGDPEKRKKYDSFGHAAFTEGAGFGGGPFAGAGFKDFDLGDSFGFNFGFGDIFEGAGAHGEGRTASHRGEDIEASMTISLEEAVGGAAKRLSIRREAECAECSGTGASDSTTCRECGGTGRISGARGFFRTAQTCPACRGTGRVVKKACSRCGMQGRTEITESLDAKIPAGVEDGSTIRLRGKGNDGRSGGPPGDLLIKVGFAKHPLFEREGSDLFIKLPLTVGEAALGAKVEVPTLYGTAVMTIPAGTQGGQRFKIKGKGLPRRQADPGDLYADAEIRLPSSLSDEAKKALGAIEASYAENPRKRLNEWKEGRR